VSKSEQRAAVGCGRLQRKPQPIGGFPQDPDGLSAPRRGPFFSALGVGNEDTHVDAISESLVLIGRCAITKTKSPTEAALSANPVWYGRQAIPCFQRD
jgi:hypothetical protein